MMSMTADPGARWRRPAFLAALLAAATAIGGLQAAAQATGPGRKPGQADEKSDPACASYGAGFSLLPGTSTCVKITGGVQADIYSTDVKGSTAIAPALKSK